MNAQNDTKHSEAKMLVLKHSADAELTPSKKLLYIMKCIKQLKPNEKIKIRQDSWAFITVRWNINTSKGNKNKYY